MKIRLQGIGIIKNSEICLDGLTVITGQNNSGKTTVGKVLYSLIDAVSDLEERADSDKALYIHNIIRNVRENLTILNLIKRRIALADAKKILEDYPTIWEILYDYNSTLYNKKIRSDIYEYADRLIDELKTFDLEFFFSNSMVRKALPQKADNNFLEECRGEISKSIMKLEKTFKTIEQDANLIEYAKESINQTLHMEFSKQIQPVSVHSDESVIEVKDETDNLLFHLEIAENNIANQGDTVFLRTPFKKSFFIDNPFILDTIGNDFVFGQFEREYQVSDSFMNRSRIMRHDEKLQQILVRDKSKSVFENMVSNQAVLKIKAEIDKVLPGEFDFTPEGDFYIQNGKKLQLSNLATGSKMFSIIKMLLEKGELDDTTVLILDEPEAHLHPSWQNKFAEIIVLFVKLLHVNILLTSHSPNFVLAIDAYMRKYEINDKTNFYQTKQFEDNCVEYVNVNHDIGEIYADFLQYLSEVKVLRDSFLEMSEDNEEDEDDK